jgi:hypothetical protein
MKTEATIVELMTLLQMEDTNPHLCEFGSRCVSSSEDASLFLMTYLYGEMLDPTPCHFAELHGNFR